MRIAAGYPFVVCIFLLWTTPLAASGQERFTNADADRITAFLHDNFDDTNNCMVIGLLDAGGSRVLSAGISDNGTDQEVNGDTVFEIGSITKTMTSLLLLDMARRDEMQLDDPVSKYLPASVTMPGYGGKEITLLNLAAQDSGLPFNPDNFSNKGFPKNYNEYTFEDMYAFLSAYKLTSEPGTAFQYSNIGMSLLGHVMGLKTGADYESLVVSRICSPLGMQSTRITLTPELKDRLARGHDKDGKRAPYYDLQVIAGAGALYSTANDLLKYLSANLGFSNTDLSPLMNEMQIIRHRGPPPWGNGAMPWYDEAVHNPPGTQIMGHGGGTPGFGTFIGFDKTKRRGVVVLSSQRILRSTNIGLAILQGMTLTKETGTKVVREFTGIGIGLETDPKTGMLKITNVVAKSPAEEAGLSKGLIIRAINGVSVDGKSIKECLGMMGGPAGTKVRLETVNAEQEEPRAVELTKRKFLLSS